MIMLISVAKGTWHFTSLHLSAHGIALPCVLDRQSAYTDVFVSHSAPIKIVNLALHDESAPACVCRAEC